MANKEERLNCRMNSKDGALLDLVVDELIDSRRQGLRICACSSVIISCALYNEVHY